MTNEDLAKRIEILEEAIGRLEEASMNGDGVLALLVGELAYATGTRLTMDNSSLKGFTRTWLDYVNEQFEAGKRAAAASAT